MPLMELTEEHYLYVLVYCSQHAVKGKHLYVSKPEAGGTFFINASYVDVSDVLMRTWCFHSHCSIAIVYTH